LLLVTIGFPVIRYWAEHGAPARLSTDLSYPEVWHLLPGWKGSILMLVVDAVALTLVFGKRAFCRYVCPYGLLLRHSMQSPQRGL
jgi:polyferredoxin